MLETTIRAVVRAVDGDEAIVEVVQGGCGRCHEKGGCGGQSLTQMMCSGPRTYRVANAGAQVGDTVTVAVPQGTVTRSANLAYVLPLCGLILGALAGMSWGGDPGAIGGGGVGLLAAWAIARWRARAGTGKDAFRPYLINRP